MVQINGFLLQSGMYTIKFVIEKTLISSNLRKNCVSSDSPRYFTKYSAYATLRVVSTPWTWMIVDEKKSMRQNIFSKNKFIFLLY